MQVIGKLTPPVPSGKGEELTATLKQTFYHLSHQESQSCSTIVQILLFRHFTKTEDLSAVTLYYLSAFDSMLGYVRMRGK